MSTGAALPTQPRPAAPAGPPAPAPIRLAIPDLGGYQPEGGIGRVLHSLIAAWGPSVAIIPAAFAAIGLPVLRNFPGGVRLPGGPPADLVFVPRLTGAQALRRAGGLPGLVTVHDVGVVDFAGDRQGRSALSQLAILQSLRGLRYARAIAVDSEFTRRRLLALRPELADRVSVIYPGVGGLLQGDQHSRAAARQLISARLGRPLGAPLLLYVGSELPRKNIATLLAAVRMLRERHPQAALLKVGRAGGPGWRARTLAAARSLGLEPGRDLLVAEGLGDDLLAAAYRAADVFVTASLYEGFGLPALEAMAAGTPVVASDRGALPEVVGQAGLVVPPEPAAIAGALARAIADPAPYRAAGPARASAFSWERAAQAYYRLFVRLAS